MGSPHPETTRPLRSRRQADPYRPGIAPAHGLRTGTNGGAIVSQTHSSKERPHVVPVLAAKPATIRLESHACAERASFRPQLEALESRWLLSTLTVLNTHDSGAGSLRADIAAANSGDVIRFDRSLAGQTIRLTSGQLVVNKSLDIEGLGAGQAVHQRQQLQPRF